MARKGSKNDGNSSGSKNSKLSGSKASKSKKSKASNSHIPVPTKHHNAKYKRKNSLIGNGSRSSTFGPIPTQPKGTKWNLPTSMGGGRPNDSKKSSTKRKSNNKTLITASSYSNKSSTTWSRNKMVNRSNNKYNKRNIGGARSASSSYKPSSKKKWTLQMPIVSSFAPTAPWLSAPASASSSSTTSQGEENQDIIDENDEMYNNRVRKIHTALALPEASLAKLNDELLAFASYVQLSEEEIASRLYVVQQVQLQCHHLFGISHDSCKVFGSFACLPVCTFASDVDMALHDVVQPEVSQPTLLSFEQSSHDENENDENIANNNSNQKNHPNKKRQERVANWKALLDEAESKNERQQQNQQITEKDVAAAIQEEKKDDGASTTYSLEVDKDVEGKDKVDCKSDSITNLNRSSRVELTHSQALPASAIASDDGVPLFVIDRDGSADLTTTTTGTNTVTITDSSRESSLLDVQALEQNKLEMKEPSRLVGDNLDSDASGNFDDDDDDYSVDAYASLKKRRRTDKKSLTATTTSTAAAISTSHVSSVACGMSARIDLTISTDAEDDDDDNDDDEQHEPLNVANRPRSRSLVSLCSGTSCSDTEDKIWDDSKMEVSFVNSKQTSKPSGPPTLSDEARMKVIRALNTLGRRLRGALALTHLHVRKKARVPIINLETKFGYECDIAIGGHNGMDTSGYARSQCERFQSFPSVVLAMKILLNQHDLDKPFSGGIGSFKLYVLVASHIEKHLEVGGKDSPAEILLTFFFRYGRIPDTSRSGLDARLRTTLTPDMVITTKSQNTTDGIAEMSSIFQLDNCVRVFQACYFLLRRKLQKPNTDPSHSLLGYLVDAGRLQNERQEYRRKIQAVRATPNRSNNNASLFPGLPPNWRSEQAKKASQEPSSMKRKSPGKTRENPLVLADTDDEAEQLKASYGMSQKNSNDSSTGSQSRKKSKAGKAKQRRNRNTKN